MQLQTHYDWQYLLKVILEISVFLNGHSAYNSQVEAQAYLNLHYGLNINLDMLTGYAQYIDPMSQPINGQFAYFQQVSDLAFQAPKVCAPLWLFCLFSQPCPTICGLVHQSTPPPHPGQEGYSFHIWLKLSITVFPLLHSFQRQSWPSQTLMKMLEYPDSMYRHQRCDHIIPNMGSVQLDELLVLLKFFYVNWKPSTYYDSQYIVQVIVLFFSYIKGSVSALYVTMWPL